MLQFETKFSEEIVIRQYKLISKILFSGLLKKLASFSIVGIVFLSLGLIAGIDDKQFFNPFTLMGSIYLIFLILFSSVFLFIKFKVGSLMKKSMDKALLDKWNTHYEFNEEGLKCSGKNHTVEYKWEGIYGYSLIENNIFIMISKMFEFSIIIGKDEISENDYATLIEVLNDKTSFKPYKKNKGSA
jgi:hypothetical protein